MTHRPHWLSRQLCILLFWYKSWFTHFFNMILEIFLQKTSVRFASRAPIPLIHGTEDEIFFCVFAPCCADGPQHVVHIRMSISTRMCTVYWNIALTVKNEEKRKHITSFASFHQYVFKVNMVARMTVQGSRWCKFVCETKRMYKPKR